MSCLQSGGSLARKGCLSSRCTVAGLQKDWLQIAQDVWLRWGAVLGLCCAVLPRFLAVTVLPAVLPVVLPVVLPMVLPVVLPPHTLNTRNACWGDRWWHLEG